MVYDTETIRTIGREVEVCKEVGGSTEKLEEGDGKRKARQAKRRDQQRLRRKSMRESGEWQSKLARARELDKQRYSRNPQVYIDRTAKRAAKWRLEKPEEAKDYYRKYYQKCHKEKKRQYSVKYRASHRKELNERQKKWQRAHPEKSRIRCRARRALRSGAIAGNQVALTGWETKWRKRKTSTCYWCKEKTPSENCHVDHINPLSKGGLHAIENVCISCQPCNNKKYNHGLEIWNKRITEPVLFL